MIIDTRKATPRVIFRAIMVQVFSSKVGQPFSPKLVHRFSPKVVHASWPKPCTEPRRGVVQGDTGETPSIGAYFWFWKQWNQEGICQAKGRKPWTFERC
jgi:hypothetical protein